MEYLIAFMRESRGAAAGLILILLLLVIWWAFRAYRDIGMKRRIERVSGNSGPRLDDDISLFRTDANTLEALIARILPSLADTRRRLRRAGINASSRVYVGVVLLLTGAASLLLPFPDMIPEWGRPLAVLMLIHFFIDRVVLIIFANRQRARMLRQLPEAIDFMVRGLAVGRSIESSIQDASEAIERPLGAELEAVPRMVRVGLSVPDALRVVAREIDLPEFDFFVAACNVQLEAGGNLTEVLTILSDTIRARHQLELKIAAMTAEGKMSAWMLSAMPLLILLYLTYSRPEYVAPLYSTESGNYVLYTAIGMIAIGHTIALRITKLKI